MKYIYSGSELSLQQIKMDNLKNPSCFLDAFWKTSYTEDFNSAFDWAIA